MIQAVGRISVADMLSVAVQYAAITAPEEEGEEVLEDGTQEHWDSFARTLPVLFELAIEHEFDAADREKVAQSLEYEASNPTLDEGVRATFRRLSKAARAVNMRLVVSALGKLVADAGDRRDGELVDRLSAELELAKKRLADLV